MKYKRQDRIIKIVKTEPVHTHDELVYILNRDGFKVTQATVSRDIKELGLVKIPSSDGGSVYSVPEALNEQSSARVAMVADSVISVKAAMHTVVISTYPGMASAVAAALDSSMRSDILGSIAGDDTVLVISESPERAEGLTEKIKNIFKME